MLQEQTSTLLDFEKRFNLARAADDIPVMIESLIGIASKQIETLPKNVIPKLLQNEQSYGQACAALKQAIKLAETHNLGDLHFAASRQFLSIATPEHINQFFGAENPFIAMMSTQLKQNG
jgi:hypothetical protein